MTCGAKKHRIGPAFKTTRLIKLSLTGGRVRFEVQGGALRGGERRELARIVAATQARVDAAPAQPSG